MKKEIEKDNYLWLKVNHGLTWFWTAELTRVLIVRLMMILRSYIKIPKIGCLIHNKILKKILYLKILEKYPEFSDRYTYARQMAQQQEELADQKRTIDRLHAMMTQLLGVPKKRRVRGTTRKACSYFIWKL